MDGLGDLACAVIPDAHGTSQDRPRRTQQRAVGRMKSEVIIRFRSGRAEMPWGLNPSSGGLEGHSWNIDIGAEVVGDEMHPAVEFGNAAGRRAVGRSPSA